MKTLKTLSFTLILAFLTVATNAKPAAGNTIDKIVAAYLDLKNALVNSDGNAAKAKAKDLVTALSAPADASLTPAQQKIFSKYQDKLLFDSRHISETNTVEHQREHFASLSTNMYEVLKAVKLNSATLYQQYCPMKKAYWLSESNQIKNPYFGSKMLTCGEVKATLASAK
jgi:hypothetical protein